MSQVKEQELVKEQEAEQFDDTETVQEESSESPKSAKQRSTGPRRSDGAGSQPQDHGPLYIGIDLGTSRTSVSASNGCRHTVMSYVGYCRDVISQKRLGRQVLIGQQALQNRLALDLVRPLKEGVINQEDPRAMGAVRELLKHAISLCKARTGQPICAVVGAPARATIQSQKALLDALDPLASSVMVVSEPFAVAYGLNILTEALVIDIGAGTTDLCRMHGTMPDESDQITLTEGGDAVDARLEEEILKQYPMVQLTRNMVRKIKEKYGFVSDPHQKCEITLTEKGHPKRVDITEALRTACFSIVPPMVEAIHELIGTFDPEFQAKLRRNVILAGGGSRLVGLPLLIENELRPLGGGNVTAVEEPTYAGSNGGLKLATEMPARYWKALA